MISPGGAGHGLGGSGRRWWPPTALALVALMASSCGSSLLGPATPSSAPAATSAPASTTTTAGGGGAVAFPVVACTTAYGAPLSGPGWKAAILLAPISTALVGRVEFYTDGSHSILGPSGWSCVGSTTSDGGAELSVEAPGVSNPPRAAGGDAGASAGAGGGAGAEGVFATFDSTGRPAGAGLVCPFFAIPQWQQSEAGCNGQKPPGEFSSVATPDVVSVFDPAGVAGSLAGSGGARGVTGTVIFPQVMPAVSYGAAIDVAVESCSIADAALCPTILSDFDVREFPVPGASGGSG